MDKYLSTFILTALLMLVIKVTYEILGTFMTFFSGNIGHSPIKNANIRTSYAFVGMIITALQIQGKDHQFGLVVSASIGCWIGTFAGNILKEKLYNKVKPYYFRVTAKSKSSYECIIKDLKTANKRLKSQGIKTIGFDPLGSGERFDKEYYHIEVMCYGKEHTREIMRIKEKYNEAQALFMYDDNWKLL